MVIKDFHNGKTHIVIRDDYAVKSDSEKRQILQNIGKIWTQAELKQMRETDDNGREIQRAVYRRGTAGSLKGLR